MTAYASGGALRAAACVLVLALLSPAGTPPARAASNFPDVPVWVIAGGWRDSTHASALDSLRCPGSFGGPMPDSVDERARAVTVRFLRDRTAESRPDFGGYRIYRMTNSPDSTRAVLIRRYSLNPGSGLSWNLSQVTKVSSVSLLPGNGDGTFAARTQITSGVAPTGVAITPINKGAQADLGIVNSGSSSVSILLGQPGGPPSLLTNPETQAGPAALAFADVNADTVMDVATANRDANSITVNIATGPIAYLPIHYPAGSQPSAIAFGELNGDAFQDIVVANQGADSISVFPRLTSGPLGRFGTRTDFKVGGQPSGVVVADLNGDVRQDVVVTNRADNTISIMLAVGTSFLRTDLPTGAAPWGIAVADVNGDTRPDVVVANSGESSVSLFLGNGVGGFGARQDIPTGPNPRTVALADLNGDARVDLVTASFTGGFVTRLLGDGAGGFGARVDSPGGPQPASVGVGDLTGDGKVDIAVANFSYDLPYLCDDFLTGSLLAVNDSVVTYVDPDSAGRYIKVCRDPGVPTGRCNSPGDSVFILVGPPGPHDGFLTWYSVTIEKRNTTSEDYEDLFVADTLDNFARCTDPQDRATCPNLNHKLRNLAGPVEPTAGPSANLERVGVVPNPYRGSEVWDQPGQGEVHFINLPSIAVIKIYTAAGDLVRELKHNDPVRDFERWDLKNASGKLVASGIYLYRVESTIYQFQSRFVVIR